MNICIKCGEELGRSKHKVDTRRWCLDCWKIIRPSHVSKVQAVLNKGKENRKCLVEGCEGKYHARGYCNPHLHKLVRYGNPNTPDKIRKDGEGTFCRGYKDITINGEQVKEHRHIMEKHLGRKLKPFPEETIHHLNGNRSDNRIENMVIMSNSEHAKLHYSLKGFPKGHTPWNKGVRG
jgi:hypothetical protein